ncbi:MAG: PorV/PorQ family protein [Ignavibacteriae bacterium]|nr:PorV/PorQ family protein [Ignavibacteriota bacterium]MCB9216280.1 PorV/PorQ family protein [Ignavibacteria bacterium]
MKHIYLFGLSLLVFAGAVATLSAQSDTDFLEILESKEFSKVGVGTGTFLNIPVGARATALGSSFAALADDPTALYWNPAGITQIAGTSVSGSYTAMFAGINHSFAGMTFEISDSYKAGISALSLSSGDIEVTTLFDQNGTGGFYSATDLAIAASIAGQLTDQFAFGFTSKVVNMSISDVSASGIAFDFGTLYDPGFLGMKIAFAVQNLSAPLKYSGPGLIQKGRTDQVKGNREPDVELESNTVSLPLAFHAGVMADLIQNNEDHVLRGVGEFTTSSNQAEGLGLGVEYVWKDLLAARVGYQTGSADAYGLSGGLGLTYQSGSFNANLDYAIRPHKNLGLLNTITASIRLR